MTDKEPTQEQIKEFWEWCGFQHHIPDVAKNLTAERYKEEQWFVPGVYCSGIPDIDLNNLFKCAVPKALEVLQKTPNYGVSISEEVATTELFRRWLDKMKGSYLFEDALFKVIWEIIREEKEAKV